MGRLDKWEKEKTCPIWCLWKEKKRQDPKRGKLGLDVGGQRKEKREKRRSNGGRQWRRRVIQLGEAREWRGFPLGLCEVCGNEKKKFLSCKKLTNHSLSSEKYRADWL